VQEECTSWIKFAHTWMEHLAEPELITWHYCCTACIPFRCIICRTSAFAAIDAAEKAADIIIEALERTRGGCNVCIKMRGDISSVILRWTVPLL